MPKMDKKSVESWVFRPLHVQWWTQMNGHLPLLLSHKLNHTLNYLYHDTNNLRVVKTDCFIKHLKFSTTDQKESMSLE